jgi:peroxiredoxin family protein
MSVPASSSAPAQVEIKAYLENTNVIRRFKYQADKFSFTTLYQTIYEIFKRCHKDETFVMHYRDDDNDLIIVSTDEEFAYAVELLQRSRDTYLKLFLTEIRNMTTASDGEEEDDDDEEYLDMTGQNFSVLQSSVVQEIDLKVQQFKNKLIQKAIKTHKKQQIKLLKQQNKKSKVKVEKKTKDKEEKKKDEKKKDK